MNPLFEVDTSLITPLVTPELNWLSGQKILITGASGFFGRHLLNSLAAATQNLNFNIEIFGHRNQIRALQTEPFATRSTLNWVYGEIANLPNLGPLDTIIHLATPTDARLYQADPKRMFEQIVGGAKHIARIAESSGAKQVLFTSSGAVYGPQPVDLLKMPEDFPLPSSADLALDPYGEGKRQSELILQDRLDGMGCQLKLARCFAFVGPYLPLDQHFAIGNFMGAALQGRPIQLSGDGRPWRSYLHTVDLVVWLLKILVHGQNGRPYNVGSDDAVTIRDLAKEVIEVAPEFGLKAPELVAPANLSNEPGPRYVPDVQRAKNELNLSVSISRKDAIRRTLNWHLESAKKGSL